MDSLKAQSGTAHPGGGLDYGLLWLLAGLWSGSFLLIKIGVGSIPPATLTAARLTIGAVLLGGWLCLRGGRLDCSGASLVRYLVIGAFGYTVPFVLISWGELHISSARAALLMGVIPLLVGLLAHFLLPNERLTWWRVGAVAVGFLGLAVLLGEALWAGATSSLAGQSAVLAAALSYASITIFIRRQMPFSGLQTATGSLLMASLTSWPLALLERPWLSEPTAASLWAALLLGVFPTALAALLFLYLVRRLPPLIFTQTNYLIPLLGSFGGVLLLGEPFHWRMALALALVLGGIYLLRHPQGRAARTAG